MSIKTSKLSICLQYEFQKLFRVKVKGKETIVQTDAAFMNYLFGICANNGRDMFSQNINTY